MGKRLGRRQVWIRFVHLGHDALSNIEGKYTTYLSAQIMSIFVRRRWCYIALWIAAANSSNAKGSGVCDADTV
jgi:hypothetical protein